MADLPEGWTAETHWGVRFTAGGQATTEDYGTFEGHARQAATMEPQSGQVIELVSRPAQFGLWTEAT